MASIRPEGFMLTRHSDLLLAIAVVALLAILVVPLPTPLMDVLISLNISFAILTLLMTLSATRPLELNTFPSLLLFLTLLRLGLNVASTRLILLRGDAGRVIQAFGDFVVGGDLIVGIVIFLILIIIQFVVITKGATRISEVAARFTLDAMPGKQLSIDADLNAGLITEEEARGRRAQITQEAEFFGAMDGASKFVRGDAIAGLIITVVNIVGGILLGLKGGMAVSEALKKFAILTVGDGLVSQIPALIIATAAGILVTKSSSKSMLSYELTMQYVSKPRAIGIGAFVVLLVSIMPGLPTIPFLAMALVLGVLYLYTRRGIEGAGEEREDLSRDHQASFEKTSLEELLTVDRLGIELGFRLIPLVNDTRDGKLMEHIGMMRRQFASTYGFIVPPIRIRDNMQLEPNEYRVLIGGQEVGRGTVFLNHYLALPSGTACDDLEGIETKEPTFGLPAKWIPRDRKEEAEMKDYTLIDPSSVLITHLSEIIKQNAADLLTRDDVQELLENLKEKSPTVVNELVPNLMTIGEVQKVLQLLLKERIPIRNFSEILEAIADHAPKSKDPVFLTERVRQAISRVLCNSYKDKEGMISVVTLDPGLERRIADWISPGKTDGVKPHHPDFLQRLVDAVSATVKGPVSIGKDVVILVKPEIRRTLSDLLSPVLPRIGVLSYNEVLGAGTIRTEGVVRLPEEALV